MTDSNPLRGNLITVIRDGDLNADVMKRITKLQKSIADRHIEAKYNGKEFDPMPSTYQGIIDGLKAGQIYKKLLDEIEFRNVNITSIMIGAVLQHKTKAYQTGVYTGFKNFLSKNGIQ